MTDMRHAVEELFYIAIGSVIVFCLALLIITLYEEWRDRRVLREYRRETSKKVPLKEN